MTTKLHIGPNLALPQDAVTQTFAILAKRGVGKTYTAAVLTEELLKAHLPVVVVDPVGVWWGLRSSADGKHAGFPILVFGGDHGDVPLEATGGALVADLVVDERVSCVLDLSLLRKGEQTTFMTAFAERLYHRNRQPLHLVLDEADAFAPQRTMHGQERCLGAIEDLVRRGRARGLGITLITQRAAVLNKDVLTQVEVLVALRTIAPQDREAIDAWVKVHGTPEQRRELMESLPSLPIGTAWFWSPGWLDVFQRVAVRKRETFDSSSTPKAGQAAHAPKTVAQVDLAAVRTKMAATIESAKASDPKHLRTRIGELEKQLAHRDVKPEKIIQRVEVPALGAADIGRLEAFATRMDEIATKARDASVAIRETMRARHAVPAPAAAPRTLPPPAQRVTARPAAALERTDAGALGSGERAVLTAIAQHDSGCTREQLSVLTGYKRSSRDTYLQRLGARGLVERTGELFTATDAGVGELGDGFAPLPTGDALREHWLEKLPDGERRVLEIVAGAYPRAVSRDAISAGTDYKRSSRDTYLQRLSARKLVVASGGEVRASDVLFNGGA